MSVQGVAREYSVSGQVVVIIMSDGDKKGHFVSYLLGALVGLLALGALVGVGLLVWYKAPRMECTVRTNETNCQLYAQRYGKSRWKLIKF